MPADDDIMAADGLLDELTSIISAAAAAIIAACAGSLDTRTKADLTPVTAADHAAEAVILEGLARLLPDTCVVSEEAVGRALPDRIPDRFVLVDPLDGTRELVAGRDEFTINLAIVDGGRPRLGIVAAPAHGLLWRGIEGSGAERLWLSPGAPANAAQGRSIVRTRPAPRAGLVAAVSRSHLDPQTEALLARLPIAARHACGSALKFCQIAEGSADVYPRFSPTCEWDVAAGHAVLAAAGGVVTTPEGAPLRYGRIAENFRVPAFVAWGDPEAAVRLGI
ncbi:MAG: 3'(2'),5'-bisphosphate nucleotidase CysQ [Xanthobacteraceae bacterium]